MCAFQMRLAKDVEEQSWEISVIWPQAKWPDSQGPTSSTDKILLSPSRQIHTYHAVPMLFPCRFKAQFTHTMPFPCCDRAMTFVSHWPPACEIGMFLVTTFLELCVVAAWSQTLAGGQHATCCLLTDDAIVWFTQYQSVPMLFACRHPAATMTRTCHERHICGIAGERHANSMVCVNQTRPHCVNQMGKTQSKTLAERHGREMAGQRHGMCESAFTPSRPNQTLTKQV
jgi:hypothetical protein